MRNKVAGSTGEEKVEVWNKSHESMSLIISEIRIKMFFLENSIILILRKIFQLEDDIFKAILSRNTTKIGTNPLVGGNRAKSQNLVNDRGDVPGWVLVVLMTTGLVTAIWTIAAPRLSTILRNSLDSMNGIR